MTIDKYKIYVLEWLQTVRAMNARLMEENMSTSATPATIEAAREAKKKFSEQFDESNLPELKGLGIASLEGGFGVKVNLESATTQELPSEIDGVPVIVNIVGKITPL